MAHPTIPGGQVATNHPGEHSWECFTVLVTPEHGGFYRVTTAGPAGVQSVVVGDIAAAAWAAASALEVSHG